jgi:hypothetical protein
VNRRLVAFADTSVGFTIKFIIVASWLALDTELQGRRCLSYVGREGSRATKADATYAKHVAHAVNAKYVRLRSAARLHVAAAPWAFTIPTV